MAQEDLPGSQPFVETPDPPAHVALRFGLDAPFTLGQYLVQSKIGQGGMGMVYRAVHGRLKRPVAIKVLPPDCMADAQAVKRFEREMEAIGRLDHHNIVRATDAGEAGGVHFLVMELVDGVDLGRLLRLHGPLKFADACELIRQAATGLQAAHEKGLVHRDIKPSNLLLSETGIVKVVDLGLALLARSASSRVLTATHQAVGTADYMAPEQWEGSHGVDIRADIYSLGCTLYTLLVGRPPFGPPDYDSAMQKMAAHANAPVKPLSSHGKDVPRDIESLIQRMTAKKPEKRPQTPAEIEKALEPFCQGADVAKLVRGLKSLTTREEEKTTDQKVQTGAQSERVLLAASAPPRLTQSKWWRVAGVLSSLAVLAIAIAAVFGPSAITKSKGTGNTKLDSHFGVRLLDELAPNQWHELLDRQPVCINRNVGVKPKYAWDSAESMLRVEGGDGYVLFLLGYTEAQHFKLQVGVSQNPWQGQVGIFWGYQERNHSKEAKVPGEEFAGFQTLRVYKDFGQKNISLTRDRVTLGYKTPEKIFFSDRAVSILKEDVPDFGGESFLEIGVLNGTLQSARFGSSTLTKLISQEMNNQIPSNAYPGYVGVFTKNNHVTFRKPSFIVVR